MTLHTDGLGNVALVFIFFMAAWLFSRWAERNLHDTRDAHDSLPDPWAETVPMEAPKP